MTGGDPADTGPVVDSYLPSDDGEWVRPARIDGLVVAFDPGRAGAGVCIELRTGVLMWAVWWNRQSPSAQSKRHPGHPVWTLNPAKRAPVQHTSRNVNVAIHGLLADPVLTPRAVDHHYVVEGLFIPPGPHTKGAQDVNGDTRLPLYESAGAIESAIEIAAGGTRYIRRPLSTIWRRGVGIPSNNAEEAELMAKRRARPALASAGFYAASTMHVGTNTTAHLQSEGAVAESLMMARWLRTNIMAGFGA